MKKSPGIIAYTLFNIGHFYNDFSDEYTKNRIEIFKTITLPSILNQKSKRNFLWIIFTNSNNKYHEKFYNLIKRYSFIIFIDTKNIKNVKSYILKISKKFFNIIEFKLDSDDAISYDFIKKLSKLFEYKNNFEIFYPKTYIYSLKDKRVYNSFYQNFCPIIFRKNNDFTIFSKEHYEWNAKVNTQINYLYTEHNFNINKNFKKITFKKFDNKICKKFYWIDFKNCKRS